MNANKQNPVDAVWDFFCSLKLTIVTLILLAVTSIIGTVIEQGKTPEEMASQLGWNLDLLRFLDKSIDAFNMYHSWWFLTLLGLFAVNLICCSIKRLPRVMKIVNEPVLIADDTLLRSLSNVEEITVKNDTAAIRDKAVAFLSGRFVAPTVTEQDGKIHLYAEKGAWTRYGVYITHLSILIIFVGAIIGNLWGYKAYVSIPEGGATDRIWRRDTEGEAPLGFSVRCDAFSVSYYEGSNRPKEFKSVLTVIENGQVVVDKRPVIVNDPLTYKGITFYQSSYNPIGDPTFVFAVRSRESGQTVNITAPFGAMRPLPGGGSFRVVDYGNNGQVARLELTGSDGRRSVADIYDQTLNISDEKRGGEYIFTLTEHKQRYATGLQVAKDPGVWVVWVGCFFMVIGSIVAFFLSHRRIWVVIVPQPGKTSVRIGGNAHRNQPGFELLFDDLKIAFKNELTS